MSKKKGNKLFSLVSAYESDAENASDSNNSENEETDQSDQESSTGLTGSRRSQGGSEKPGSEYSGQLDSAKKRAREDNFSNQGDEIELEDTNTRPFDENTNDEDTNSSQDGVGSSKKLRRDEPTNEASFTHPENNDQDMQASTENQAEGSQEASKSIYTIENGFLKGCENIRIPAAPKAQCSKELQGKIIAVVNRMKHYNY